MIPAQGTAHVTGLHRRESTRGAQSVIDGGQPLRIRPGRHHGTPCKGGPAGPEEHGLESGRADISLEKP